MIGLFGFTYSKRYEANLTLVRVDQICYNPYLILSAKSNFDEFLRKKKKGSLYKEFVKYIKYGFY